MSNLQKFISRLDLPKSNNSECTRFSLRKISINHSRVIIDLFDKPSKYETVIGESVIKFRKFNLCSHEFRVSIIDLKNPEVAIISKNVKSSGEKDDSLFSFPWNITIDDIKISGGKLRSKAFDESSGIKTRRSLIDFADLDLQSIDFDAHDIDINDSINWKFSIGNLSFTEKSGFNLRKFSIDEGIFTNKKLNLQTLTLKTEDTDISSDVKLVYDQVEDFKDFENKVFISVDFSIVT